MKYIYDREFLHACSTSRLSLRYPPVLANFPDISCPPDNGIVCSQSKISLQSLPFCNFLAFYP